MVLPAAEDDAALTEEEKAIARFQKQRMKELKGARRMPASCPAFVRAALRSCPARRPSWELGPGIPRTCLHDRSSSC